MFTSHNRRSGPMLFVEMAEFASFPESAQRYIRRSLGVALHRPDAVRRWGRNSVETARIEAQQQVYKCLDGIAALIPDDDNIAETARLIGPLVALSAFDLSEGRLSNFAAYRFLYERLIGAAVRPWLPSAFCAASALPHLHPKLRRELLQSLPCTAMTAPGWSLREPAFFPEWIDKVEDSIDA
ncbi:hypothetical protein [Sphingosinicella humi]|uniref:Uncharacterized protein n=1 Tax=Allosphingosinicella humi TaxID=2068657 RepID=A0A2U2J4J9_9SPHN|nr:hypothetical protein [Sphingosinicella humi]PWG03270.1 hypothetical protein DF286_10630 [Sphingosinicella humi]